MKPALIIKTDYPGKIKIEKTTEILFLTRLVAEFFACLLVFTDHENGLMNLMGGFCILIVAALTFGLFRTSHKQSKKESDLSRAATAENLRALKAHRTYPLWTLTTGKMRKSLLKIHSGSRRREAEMYEHSIDHSPTHHLLRSLFQ